MEPMEKVLSIFGHSLGLPPQYRFLKRISKAPDGEVWQAADTKDRRMVHIKLIPRERPDQDQLDTVRREASLLAQLGYGHINIARAVEVLLTTRHIALVMESVSGASVAEYLSKQKISEDFACYLFRQLLSAMQHCRKHAVACGPFHPSNVVLTNSRPPVLKRGDFGRQAAASSEPSPSRLCRACSAPDPTAASTSPHGSPRSSPLPTFMNSSKVAPEPAAHSGPLRAVRGSSPMKSVLSMPLELEATSTSASSNISLPLQGCLGACDCKGSSADVYSAGLFLALLVLRHAPWEYERYAAQLPPLPTLFKLWGMSPTEVAAWKARVTAPGPPSTSQDASVRAGGRRGLSTKLKQLLDSMLAIDESQRPSLVAVAGHPWVNRSLGQDYSLALHLLEREQAGWEARVPPFDEDELAARMDILDDMLSQAAGRKGRGHKLLSRLPLTERVHCGRAYGAHDEYMPDYVI